MDCFNYFCPFRENTISNANRCECVACPNRCHEQYTFSSNKTLTAAELAEIKKQYEGGD